MIFHADNGEGPFTTTFTPKLKWKSDSVSPQFDLCNGKWHSIRAVKDKRTLELSIDGIAAETVTHSGPGGLSTVDTGDWPLHIGGIPGKLIYITLNS